MNFKLFAIITILLIGGSTILYAQNSKEKKGKKETVTLDVSMTCENCKKRIEKNIAYEKGVTDMKVDLPTKTVFIEYRKDKTSVEKLIEAFKKLGYEASVHNNKQHEEQ